MCAEGAAGVEACLGVGGLEGVGDVAFAAGEGGEGEGADGVGFGGGDVRLAGEDGFL